MTQLEVRELADKKQDSIVLHLLLTNRCNLQCNHCCNDSQAGEPEGLSMEICKSLADSCRPAGVTAVHFTGGEVTLRRDLVTCIEHFAAVGIKPGFFTNGINVSDQLLQELDGRISAVSVSVDGPQQHHDYLRALPGAFDRTIRFIARVKDMGWHCLVQCTVTQGNLRQLDKVAEWAESLGLSRLHFTPLELAGRATVMPERERLTVKDLHLLFDTIARLKGDYPEMEIGLRGMSDTTFIREHPCNVYACQGSCHEGRSSFPRDLVITSDGTVYPLIKDLHPFFQLGNVNNRPLSDLVQEFERSDRFMVFQLLCKYVFQEMISHYPYPLFPWLASLGLASRSEKFWSSIGRTMPPIEGGHRVLSLD